MVYRRGLVEACVGGILAALSVVMTMAKLAFPFPVLPYLKFELAEIPVVIAAASLPPRVSLYASLAYWFVLLLVGEWTPIGPTMKFLAVISTVAGSWRRQRSCAGVGGSGPCCASPYHRSSGRGS